MENDITERVRDYICRRKLIDKGHSVCVAVSGGADSMCLLFLLWDLRKSLDITLSAVHVEHGIRGRTSLEDMAYVTTQCEKLGVPLKKARVNACAVANMTGTTLEEAARNERYRIFEGIDSDRIALAHHMNDQAETFIFNTVRGSGIRGLKGMSAIRERYVRPLLCVTRIEIEEYCRNKGIEYRVDETNSDVRLARNRIRLEVMPLLLEINAGAVRHINETMADIADAEDYIESVLKEAFDNCILPEMIGKRRDIIIDIDALETLHPFIASYVVREALIRTSGRSKDISRRHIDSVLSLAKGQSGRHADLIYGIKAYKEFRRLILRGPGEYEIPEDDLSPVYTVLQKSEVSMDQIISSGNYTKYIDYATIGDTSYLSVRHRQQGDLISIKGGRKRLKELLIEEKIPVENRDRMYLIAIGSEIVWIPELGRIGERFKVKDNTERILRMEIKND